MISIKNENIIFCDVDETLVCHMTRSKDIIVKDPYDGKFLKLKIHKRHVKLLKDHKARGYTVIIWSAAGVSWCNTIVKALKLEKYVDYTMTKPGKYVDDLKADEILGQRIYLEDK